MECLHGHNERILGILPGCAKAIEMIGFVKHSQVFCRCLRGGSHSTRCLGMLKDLQENVNKTMEKLEAGVHEKQTLPYDASFALEKCHSRGRKHKHTHKEQITGWDCSENLIFSFTGPHQRQAIQKFKTVVVVFLKTENKSQIFLER